MAGFADNEVLKILPHLKSFSMKLTKNIDEAEDLVSDTMVKVFSARDRFEPDSDLRAWCFVIMRNQFLTKIRRNRFVGETYEGAELNILAPSNPDAILELEEVLWFIDHIPEERAQALITIAQGYSYEEAAEMCGTEVGTIKSRVGRARADLERYFS